MSIVSIISGIASSVVSPIANVFTKRNDNKTKVKVRNIDRLANAEDKVAEWEAIQAEGGGSSWKDEYITIIITIPIPIIFFAVMYSVISGDPSIAEGARAGVEALKMLVPNYQELLYVVALAAVGIKAFKRP
jgi:hypothetical protein